MTKIKTLQVQATASVFTTLEKHEDEKGYKRNLHIDDYQDFFEKINALIKSSKFIAKSVANEDLPTESAWHLFHTLEMTERLLGTFNEANVLDELRNTFDGSQQLKNA